MFAVSNSGELSLVAVVALPICAFETSSIIEERIIYAARTACFRAVVSDILQFITSVDVGIPGILVAAVAPPFVAHKVSIVNEFIVVHAKTKSRNIFFTPLR